MMSTLVQDLRFALRALLKNRVFTGVAVLTLALGIGVNTAIFTVVDATLLRPLPYPEPDRLVDLWEIRPLSGEFGRSQASYPNFLDYQSQTELFSSFGAYLGFQQLVSMGSGAAEMLPMAVVSGDFFKTLGTRPALGRLLNAADDQDGSERVAVISHGMWQRRFGGRADVLGKTFTLKGTPYSIVGVVSPEYQFALSSPVEAWVPQRNLLPDDMKTRRSLRWVKVLGRLAPGVSRELAQTKLRELAARLATEYPAANTNLSIELTPLRDEVVGPVRPLLLLMLGAVGLVLLIACGNVANLMLARAASRQREMAIRQALGAGRGRLVQQLLTESLLLAVLGGCLGLLCAQWGLEVLLSAIPAQQLAVMPYLSELSLDGRVLGFTAGVSILTGVLFGLVPALTGSRADVRGALQAAAPNASGSARSKLRRALVVAEVALALVLLVGAGLLLKSMTRMMAVDPGFERQDLLTGYLVLPQGKYQAPGEASDLMARLVDQLQARPDVQGAAFVSRLPLSNGGNTARYVILGRPPGAPGQDNEAFFRTVSTGYFQTLKVPLVRGRFFAQADGTDAPKVVIINQALAARLFPGQDPVGQSLRLTFSPTQPPREIVGVVANENMESLDAVASPAMYVPIAQDDPDNAFLAVRLRRGATGMAATLLATVKAENPELVLVDVRTLDERVETSSSVFLRRYPTLVVGAFASVALLLALVGVYGVIAYSIAQRTREISIRLALGARRVDVLSMVVREGAGMALMGVGLGLVGALALGRVLQRVLFGVDASDPLVLAGGAVLLVLMAVLASYLPARRASRVEPAEALR
ncbi:ABC transporter permease [Corallococcus sp. M34]|uniref:ABC transporter permease n=1 Tax=Citreicoccus inhibens TaxID=2849499 RepID=UPI001C24FB98|nr:ABC transporter permease [Citreicoccus inhibens]MBU8898894.1 ABC transporter permease [Citreicoccus inhibens]